MEYNELSEEAKENARENVKEALSDYIDDNIYELLNDKLAEEIGSAKDFTLEYIPDSFDKVALYGKLHHDDIKNLPFASLINDDTSININYTNGTNVNIELSDEDSYTEEQLDTIEKEIEKWFNKIIIDLEAYADDLNEDFYSDEFAEERADMFDFDVDGDIVY
jgi:hypothetical protein